MLAVIAAAARFSRPRSFQTGRWNRDDHAFDCRDDLGLVGSHSKEGSPCDATPTLKHPVSRLDADLGMNFIRAHGHSTHGHVREEWKKVLFTSNIYLHQERKMGNLGVMYWIVYTRLTSLQRGGGPLDLL